MSPLPSFSWILLQPGRGRHWDVRRFQPLLQLRAEDIPRCWKGTGFLCACPWHWRRAVTSSERVTGTASLAGKVPSVLGPAWSQPSPHGQGCVASISLATGGTSPPLCWPEPNRADRRTRFRWRGPRGSPSLWSPGRHSQAGCSVPWLAAGASAAGTTTAERSRSPCHAPAAMRDVTGSRGSAERDIFALPSKRMQLQILILIRCAGPRPPAKGERGSDF